MAKSLRSSRSINNSVGKRRTSEPTAGGGWEEIKYLTFEFSEANTSTQVKDLIVWILFQSNKIGFCTAIKGGCISYLLLCNKLSFTGFKYFYLFTILWVSNIGWAQQSGSSAGLVWDTSVTELIWQLNWGWMVQNGFMPKSGDWCLLLAEPLSASFTHNLSSPMRLTRLACSHGHSIIPWEWQCNTS